MIPGLTFVHANDFIFVNPRSILFDQEAGYNYVRLKLLLLLHIIMAIGRINER